MVIIEDRKRLRGAIVGLFDGALTPGDFRALCREMQASDDAGVSEIAAFCSVFADAANTLPPFGITEIEPELRQVADRCLHFLKTECEYRWPIRLAKGGDSGLFVFLLVVPLVTLGFLGGCLLSLAALVSITKNATMGMIAGAGAGVLFVPTWLLLRWYRGRNQRLVADEEADFWRHGDQAAWPFLMQDEHQFDSV